jgi:hypothetical protein
MMRHCQPHKPTILFALDCTLECWRMRNLISKTKKKLQNYDAVFIANLNIKHVNPRYFPGMKPKLSNT